MSRSTDAGLLAVVLLAWSPPPEPALLAGQLEVPRSFLVDLDNGTVGGEGADPFFEAVSSAERYLSPWGESALAPAGTREMGLSGWKAARLAGERVPASRLQAGHYLCVLTNDGRYAQLRVIGLADERLTIEYETW